MAAWASLSVLCTLTTSRGCGRLPLTIPQCVSFNAAAETHYHTSTLLSLSVCACVCLCPTHCSPDKLLLLIGISNAPRHTIALPRRHQPTPTEDFFIQQQVLSRTQNRQTDSVTRSNASVGVSNQTRVPATHRQHVNDFITSLRRSCFRLCFYGDSSHHHHHHHHLGRC